MADDCSEVSPGLHLTPSLWDLLPQLQNEAGLSGSTQERRGTERVEFHEHAAPGCHLLVLWPCSLSPRQALVWHEAAVYFKEGTLFSCCSEAEFACAGGNS